MATKAERLIAARDWLYEYFAVQTDNSLRNGENSAMVKMLTAYEAATIERCAQIADKAAENEHTMMLGLRKNGLGEATVGSEKLVKLGKSVAAAIRSMKGAE